MLKVAIIGASHKPHRYAYQAHQLLLDYGHKVFPVSPKGMDILDTPGFTSISDIADEVHTVTLYVNPQRHLPISQDILGKKPQRIIFNPGTESEELEMFYQQHGIETLRACTLVMLKTAQFEV